MPRPIPSFPISTTPKSFLIVSEQDNKLACYIEGSSINAGAKLIIGDRHRGDNQRFRFYESGYIQNVNSSLFLYVSDTDKEANVVQINCKLINKLHSIKT